MNSEVNRSSDKSIGGWMRSPLDRLSSKGTALYKCSSVDPTKDKVLVKSQCPDRADFLPPLIATAVRFQLPAPRLNLHPTIIDRAKSRLPPLSAAFSGEVASIYLARGSIEIN